MKNPNSAKVWAVSHAGANSRMKSLNSRLHLMVKGK
jgi:hypothetical protein